MYKYIEYKYIKLRRNRPVEIVDDDAAGRCNGEGSHSGIRESEGFGEDGACAVFGNRNFFCVDAIRNSYRTFVPCDVIHLYIVEGGGIEGYKNATVGIFVLSDDDALTFDEVEIIKASDCFYGIIRVFKRI